MSLRHGFVRGVKVATIADEASLSDEVHLNGLTLAAIIVPSGWVAADITFQGSVDGSVYRLVTESGADAELTIQAAASRYILISEPASFGMKGLLRLRVQSGTNAVPVVQTAGPILLQLVLTD